MGPKKPKAPKKPKKEEPEEDGDFIDGRQLWMATDALARTKAMRNYFQLERDKINAFWEITKREIEAVQAEIRNKDRLKAEMQERHQVEMKVYTQKMRHVLYENKVHVSQMKIAAERELKNKQEEHREKEVELQRDRRDLKLARREQEILHRDMVNQIQDEQDREITGQLKDCERQMKELHLKYDKKIKNLRDEMEAQRKDDIELIETRKREHADELKAAHQKAFDDIRDYYTEITTNNLETIKTLKEDVYMRKKHEATNEKSMFEIAQTNKRLTEPLTKANQQRRHLIQELQHKDRDEKDLKATKQELRQLEQKMKTLLWEHEVLGQRFAKVEEDRDLIFGQYNKTLQEIQQKAVFKRVLLHRKLEVVQSQVERKDAQLAEVLKNANVDQSIAQTAEQKLDNIVEEKNRTIEDLQRLLANVTVKHDKVVAAYEAYLRQNGVFGLTAA